MDSQPFLANFLIKLLDGRENITAPLLKKNPFPSRPPKFLKIDKYKYFFTRLDSIPEGEYVPLKWWNRRKDGEYLKPINI